MTMKQSRALSTCKLLSRTHLYSTKSSVWKVRPRLNQEDIDAINDNFIKRTSGLEPSITTIKPLKQIYKDFGERYKVRYVDPCRNWSHLETLKPAKTFNYDKLWTTPLQIGDLVLLKSNPNELSMCVALPHSVKDPRYTFVDVDGKINFYTRHNVQLRLPGEGVDHTRAMIQTEADYKYASIGTIRDKNTVILPSIVREKVTNVATAAVTQEAWNMLPLTLKKLELINQYLQSEIINNQPLQIPFVCLTNLIQGLDLNKYDNSAYLSKFINDGLHNQTPVNNTTLSSSTFLATYWGITEQQTSGIWGDIVTNPAILSPISVSVLPVKPGQQFYLDLIHQLSQNNYKQIKNFTNLINKKQYDATKIKYPGILKLLLEYSAGNFIKNLKTDPVVSIISIIFRNLNSFKSKDVTRDSSFQLLKEIDPTFENVNPLLYNKNFLNMEKQENGNDIYEKYKDLEQVKQTLLSDSNTFTDVQRTDYNSLPVYCIDSETAHEIDDGISIRKFQGKNNYTLFIHIADPIACFPESQEGRSIIHPILQIAKTKGFTTYLPDIVDPMLPKGVSDYTGLGVSNKITNAITFSVNVNYSKDSGLIINKESFKIELSHVSQFPKVTYNIVDQILDDNLENVDKSLTSQSQAELKLMANIAIQLRKQRVKNDNAIIFGEGFNKGMVQITTGKDVTEPTISFSDQTETLSTILVSEFMILANKLSGEYFTQNKIPGIFRCYNRLSLGPSADKSYETLVSQTKGNNNPDITDIVKISSLLNASVYSSVSQHHEMLGAKSYLTVTSPLRRMPDLINHIQIHRYLKKLELAFNHEDIDSIIWNIQSRADIIKRLSNNVSSYWTLKYLKDKISSNPSLRFDVLVTSYPNDGRVLCMFPKLSFARGSLRLNTKIPHPKIGTVVKNCKIINIDCIENNLELDMNNL